MTAEAIARLREKRDRCDRFRAVSVDVEVDDLRALLDAHAALEAEVKKAHQAGITETYYFALKALNEGSDEPVDLQVAAHALRAERDEAMAALRLVVDEFGWVSTIEDGHACVDPVLAVLAKAGRR